VPGVLSSSGGRDFGAFLGALGELGYGWSYRVLDAQYFGVPQRRRRVFVVGCLGNWKLAAKVLFESESLSRNTKSSRKKGKEITGFVESSFGQYREDNICGTLKASGGVLSGGSETFITIPIHPQAMQFKGGGKTRNNDGKGNALGVGNENDPMFTLTTADKHMVAYENHPSDARITEINVSPTMKSRWGTGGGNIPLIQNVDTYNLTMNNNTNQALRGNGCIDHVGGVIKNMAVRKLTPVECERLQGFPDNYTNIKENCPDGPRYKALGNSMAVPVMKWIGERIANV
jgi:DNA (cytosine-5)-methyltransferase 1